MSIFNVCVRRRLVSRLLAAGLGGAVFIPSEAGAQEAAGGVPWSRPASWEKGLPGSTAVSDAEGVKATEEPAEKGAVPPALRAALGWVKPTEKQKRSYGFNEFNVTSETARWAEAARLAKVWAAEAPGFDADYGQHLFRRFTRVQALILNVADDPAALAELREERRELLKLADSIKANDRKDDLRWQREQAERQLRELTDALGLWLVDSPADRLELFREQMKALQPKERTKLAARYGGEAQLAELIGLLKKRQRLEAAVSELRSGSDGMPAEERAVALGKAMGELGYFEGLHLSNKSIEKARYDEDVRAELGGDGYHGGRDELKVPDLVGLAGEKEAEALLAQAFALPAGFEFEESRTQALARAMILKGRMPVQPPVGLLAWPGDEANLEGAKQVVKLYEFLKAQYPDLSLDDNRHWSQRSARPTVAYALAAVGRKDEALAMYKGKVSSGAFSYDVLIDKAVAVPAWELVLASAGAEIGDAGWGQLSELAPAAGREAELVALAKARADAASEGAARRLWRLRQGWALLAADNVEAGLAVLTPVFMAETPAGDQDEFRAWSEAAGRFLMLARVLPKPELAAQLRERFRAEFARPGAAVWGSDSLVEEFARQEIAAGNLAGLERLLRARLDAIAPKPLSEAAKAEPADKAEDEEADRYVNAQDMAERLADVLSLAGRHDEVLTLFSTSSAWRSKDIGDLMGGYCGTSPARPTALVAAEALLAAGRTAEALAILEAYLTKNTGHDPSYAAYVKIRGQEALPFLQKLRAQDRYEERPLIWTAVLQLAAGDTDGAETTIKQAIAIDPSDGEQPKNDRMRAYAVAREVALKKGDAKQAEFFAGVLAAIRRSEAADDLIAVGMTRRGIAEYREALESFADAYCIQSRLARQLAGENRIDEAMEHYKRAFELMPDSFGRVESHCFGCENAFAGDTAQEIAERVFMTLAEKTPVKPQVFYLLGYLRQEQGRQAEAAGYFTKAVEADPEYLNAWIKLSGTQRALYVPAAERDKVVFRLLALDLTGRRGGAEIDEVRDLRALWQAGAGRAALLPLEPGKLLPLGDRAPVKRPAGRGHGSDEDELKGGPALLGRNAALSAVVQALRSAQDWQREE